MSEDERLAVSLGERSYDIVVGSGLLARAGVGAGAGAAPAGCDHRHRRQSRRARRISGFWSAVWTRAGIARRCIVLPPGETTKSMAQLGDLLERLLDQGVDRATTIVAFGGGVIGDLAGFAAAILLRGLDCVQVPTTLLAQVDSAIGGKTGINTRHGKNLVGAFHQPRLVLADTAVLASLPPRELRAGYAEVVKYGLIDRPDFFAWLEAHGREVIAGDAAAQQHAVLESCRAKAAVVAADEREGGVRALLNLGHTFAPWPRGGVRLRRRAAARRGGCRWAWCSRSTCRSASACAPPQTPTGCAPTSPPSACRSRSAASKPDGFAVDTLLAAMGHDKKAQAGRPRFVLTRGIGRAFAGAEVAPAELAALLEAAA